MPNAPTPTSWAIMSGLLPMNHKGDIPAYVMREYRRAMRKSR